ncbi:hypothetical protein B0H10DRAFT_2238005 [Mycena sp. CBHHK59/15]|nr:hypothetical protein B0H10DRAFT_2238005 [Mycena sp. CBHHK59/15]
MDEQMSSSDEESLYALSQRGTPPPALLDDHDSDIELLDGPPSHPSDSTVDTDRGPRADSGHEAAALPTDLPLFAPEAVLAERDFMARVNAPGLSYAAKVNLLIAKIQWLRPTPSATPTSVPAATSPDLSQQMPVGVMASAAAPVDPIQYSLVEERALFFIGMQVPQGRRSFVEVLRTLPPDGTIFARLSIGAPMLGRALRAIGDRTHFFVGTTDVPVDVFGDYMNHVHNFRELGSWADIDGPHDSPLSLVTPAPMSAARTALLATRNLHDSIPVYILYIYHEDTETVCNAVPGPILPPPAMLPAPAPLPVVGAAAQSSSPRLAETAFLRNRFATRLERIRISQITPYGTAYRHCMQEKHIIAICNSLGINLNLRAFAPVTVEGGLEISFEDVVHSAGLNHNTFAGTRTTVNKAREARRLLARYIRVRDSGGHVSEFVDPIGARLI